LKSIDNLEADPVRIRIRTSLDVMYQKAMEMLEIPEEQPIIAFFNEDFSKIVDISEIKPDIMVYGSQKEEIVQENPVEEDSLDNLKIFEEIPEKNAENNQINDSKDDLTEENVRILVDQTEKSEDVIEICDFEEDSIGKIEENDNMNILESEKSKEEPKILDEMIQTANSSIYRTGRSTNRSSTSSHRDYMTDSFMQYAEIMESQQRQTVSHEFEKLLGQTSPLNESLEEDCLEFLKTRMHTSPFAKNGAFSTSAFRIAILGPVGSGRSTYLKSLAKNLMRLNLVTGQSHHTAIFFYDMKSFSDTIHDPIQFYKIFISSTIRQIAIQYPLLLAHPIKSSRIEGKNSQTPVFDSLLNSFLSLSENGPIHPISSKFPHYVPFHSMVPSIQMLLDLMRQSLDNMGDLQTFYTNLFSLPRSLSQCFGFKNSHFFIDHFEIGDISVSSKLNKGLSQVYIIEYIKMMINMGTYAITGEYDSRLIEILDPIDENGIDLRSSTSYKTVIGLCQAPAESYDIVLKFEGSEKQSVLKKEICCGCSGFLAKWDIIIQHIKQLNNEMSKSQEQRLRLKLLLLIRDLAPMVLSHVDQTSGDLGSIPKIIDFQINTKK